MNEVPEPTIPDPTIKAAHQVADTLDQRGHTEHAGRLRAALRHGHSSSMLRTALRDACQVVLTAIEAIDPVCATMVEELRLKVDARLGERHRSAAGIWYLRSSRGSGEGVRLAGVFDWRAGFRAPERSNVRVALRHASRLHAVLSDVMRLRGWQLNRVGTRVRPRRQPAR